MTVTNKPKAPQVKASKPREVRTTAVSKLSIEERFTSLNNFFATWHELHDKRLRVIEHKLGIDRSKTDETLANMEMSAVNEARSERAKKAIG